MANGRITKERGDFGKKIVRVVFGEIARPFARIVSRRGNRFGEIPILSNQRMAADGT